MLQGRRVLLGLSIIFLALFIYRSFLRELISPLIELPNFQGGLILTTLSLVIFSLTHALYSLGWRRTIVFFALSAVIAFVFEEVGVVTGLIYGPYHYTGDLGVKLGHVPLLIPLAWFMMVYPSYVLANFIVAKRPAGSAGSRLTVVWLSLVSAVVMTAWDTVIDPILSGARYHYWVWESPGPYFGVPVHNYAGWLLTTFCIYLAYRFAENRWEGRGEGAEPRTRSTAATAAALLPLIAYGTMMVSNIYHAEPAALQVIAPFTMGLPLMLALAGYLEYRRASIAGPGA